MVKLTEHFNLSEFKGVRPDPRLLYLLNELREWFGAPLIITDGPRTVREHLELYTKLEEKKLFKTLKNALGTKMLIDAIPWGSRHLPSHDNPYLRAVDFKVMRYDGKGYVRTSDIRKIILNLTQTTRYVDLCEKNNLTQSVGIGEGKTFIHLDIDRKKNTLWKYDV